MTDTNPLPEPEVLISESDLQLRVSELAVELSEAYRNSENLLCIGVLKGSVFFMVDLLKQMDVPLSVDFFQTSSYRSGKVPGEVRILKDVDLSVRDRDVLLIEDIVDTGHTLRTILSLLEFRGARSVRLCALLDKKARREVDIPIHYAGFAIEDRFVVGYGLDYDERFRNLPFIGVCD
jgi:hypoxanthine phosphoribosyltransferase